MIKERHKLGAHHLLPHLGGAIVKKLTKGDLGA